MNSPAFLNLHGQEEVLHDDAVEVEEADYAGHAEVAGLGAQEVVDPVQVHHVHLLLLLRPGPAREQLPGKRCIQCLMFNVYMSQLINTQERSCFC